MKVTRDFGLHFVLHRPTKDNPYRWTCLICDCHYGFMYDHFPEGSLVYRIIHIPIIYRIYWFILSGRK